ncbi:helix-turn-helix transcriptional regulator [Kribbella sp.]|uniref:helix-turn-helix transcriptional regulator n=1 Tax=Kribbella sp. TaxID=1871183 RepID=UPI002D6CE950|nr:helix-turn-helix transcriptional regulator [Kribbella sp.]HZX05583.1 helix-turn-helix transcriptional regulator [Kribbella sp.]
MSAGLPEALGRIAAERDWDALQVVCDQHLLSVDGELAARLLDVLTLVPDDELRARPRLMMSWLSVYYAATQPDASELRPFLRHYTELGTRLAASMDIDSETSVATLTTVGVAAMIALREQGRCVEAEELGQRLSARAAQLSPLPGVDSGWRPGWLPLQRGLTRTLMDDLPAAVELYRHAYELATLEPPTAGTALNAAANLAMIFANLGHAGPARQWLQRMREFEAPSQRVRFLLTVGGSIAEGWDALDRYDDTELASRLEIIGDGTRRIEVWPFAAALVFAHGLYRGDQAAALAHLGTLRLSHAPELTELTAASQVLRRAWIDLLTATGQGTRALRLIKETGANEPWLTLPTARIRFLNGEYAAVRALASRLSWGTVTSYRDLRQLLLLKAIAALRMGDVPEARAAADLTDRLRAPDEVLSLASLAPAERAEIQEIKDFPLTDEARERLARAPGVFPDRLDLVELTSREHAVLTELDAGGSTPEIAGKLVVSVNTVRTQVKSVYRKLGASSREDAVLRAYELGLL